MNVTDEQILEFIKKEYLGLSNDAWKEEMQHDCNLIKKALIYFEQAHEVSESNSQALPIESVRRSFFNFKYKWSMRKYWIGWFKRDLKRWYYSKMHGFKMGNFNGTMIPTTGKGKFVSVYSKGQIIQIKHESGYEHLEYDEIRIIPCKENHGVMVERFKNGKMCDRNHMDLNQFNKGIVFASNVEQLANR